MQHFNRNSTLAYRSTVVGSYPRPSQVEDTLKKPTLRSISSNTADLIFEVGHHTDQVFQALIDRSRIENLKFSDIDRKKKYHRAWRTLIAGRGSDKPSANSNGVACIFSDC